MHTVRPYHDVIVVGAGPGGSTAAFHLARRGHKVLLVDQAQFPRDKACGDGLTEGAFPLLDEMGLGALLAQAQPIGAIALFGQGRPDGPSPLRVAQPGCIIARKTLDAAMVARARAAGAEFWPNVTVRDFVADDQGCRLGAMRGGRPISIASRFVVAADGARSVVARRAGLLPADAATCGVALRGYFRLQGPLSPDFHVHIPLQLDDFGRRFAGYGWAFPVDDGLANLGVGYFPTQPRERLPNPRAVFDAFIATAERQPDLAGLSPAGPTKGGLLHCAHDADRCHGRRALLVGDAAGLVDPFTGEGIKAAILSGALAAEALSDRLAQDRGADSDLDAYADLLRDAFGRRPTPDRLFASYPLAWRLVEEPLRVSGRVPAMVQRAATASRDRVPPPLPASHPHAAFVAEGSERVWCRIEDILDRQSPFFWKIVRGTVDQDMASLRLAAFFLHLAAGGGAIDDESVGAAAAVEMCSLALELQAEVTESRPPVALRGDRFAPGGKWADSFAIMAGDCLLSESYRILADLSDAVREAIASSAPAYCAARLEQIHRAGAGALDEVAALDLAEQTSGRLFGLACLLGTLIAGRGQSEASRADAIGRELGVAARLLGDVAAVLAPPRAEIPHPLAQQLRASAPGYPIAWALARDPSLAAAAEPGGEAEAPLHDLLHALRGNGALDAARTEALARLNRVGQAKGAPIAPLVAGLGARAARLSERTW